MQPPLLCKSLSTQPGSPSPVDSGGPSAKLPQASTPALPTATESCHRSCITPCVGEHHSLPPTRHPQNLKCSVLRLSSDSKHILNIALNIPIPDVLAVAHNNPSPVAAGAPPENHHQLLEELSLLPSFQHSRTATYPTSTQHPASKNWLLGLNLQIKIAAPAMVLDLGASPAGAAPGHPKHQPDSPSSVKVSHGTSLPLQEDKATTIPAPAAQH